MLPDRPAGQDAASILGWQVRVLQMRLNSVLTANDINFGRLEMCERAAPPEASGVVG